MTHITIERAKAQRIADAFEDLRKNYGISYIEESVDICQALAAQPAPTAYAGYHITTDKVEIFTSEKSAIDWRDQYQPGFARVEKLVSGGVVEWKNCPPCNQDCNLGRNRPQNDRPKA